MKKLVYSILAFAAVLFAVSCQRETQMAREKGGLVDVTFQVGLNGLQTKAFSDGTSATTLDVLVYSAREDGDVYLPNLAQQTAAAFENLAAQVNLKLVRGENYKIVFWAHAPESPYTVDPDNATLTVTAAVTNSPAPVANDELRDGFWAVKEIAITGSVSERVELKRPFAQINVLTTDADWQAAIDNGITFAGSSMKVWAPSEMNLLTGDVSKEVEMAFAFAPIDQDVNIPQFDMGFKYIAMNYILAGASSALIGETSKPFSFTVYKGQDSPLPEQTLVSVPVQRNYRTIILGDVFCVNAEFEVAIVPDYDGANEFNPDDTAVAVTITADDITVEEGKTVPIGATITPASTGAVTYTSGDQSIAMVDADGGVTGVAAGNTTITIKVAAVDGQFKAAEKQINVTVTAAQQTAPDIAIDGDFADWANVTAITGTGAIKAMKVAYNDTQYFFYLEADKTKLNTDTSNNYANYFTLHFDDGDLTGNLVSYYWNQAGLDAVILLWLMQQGVPNLITWNVDGFDHKEAVDGDVAKFEFCLNRTAGSVFAGQHLLFAASVDGEYVDGDNNWKGSSDFIGFAPASDQDMADVGPTPVTPATDTAVAVTINANDVEVEEGKTAAIGATTTPVSTGAISYTSGDESIATVNADGVVTGVAAGTTTITIDVAAVPNEFKAAQKQINVTVTAAQQTATGITIDGDMSDWANITGITGTDKYLSFKAAYDDTYIYFYSKRNNDSALWGGSGYYYYAIDLDNDTTSTMSNNQGGQAGVDTWVVVYPFGGSSSAQEIVKTPTGGGIDDWSNYTSEANSCAGVIGSSEVETEVRIPRADLNIQKGTIKIYSWGNKSAGNIKTDALTLTIEK